MNKAPYTECRIYFDGGGRRVAVGHYIRTKGSAYWITACRQNKRRPYRKHLTCLRWPIEEIPAGAVVHVMRWYPRDRTRSKRR